jgi:histone deacetylase 6
LTKADAYAASFLFLFLPCLFPSASAVNAEEIVATRDWYHNLSLYISPDTGLAAQLSAGGVIETALAVMDPLSDIRNAFALVRPPGHHAEPHEHMGFCFFNNVAVATGVLQERYPGKKIAIVDWDVHHGEDRLQLEVF